MTLEVALMDKGTVLSLSNGHVVAVLARRKNDGSLYAPSIELVRMWLADDMMIMVRDVDENGEVHGDPYVCWINLTQVVAVAKMPLRERNY